MQATAVTLAKSNSKDDSTTAPHSRNASNSRNESNNRSAYTLATPVNAGTLGTLVKVLNPASACRKAI
jgi:hypothetical protein